MQSVFQIVPKTNAAKDWIRDNVQYEAYQKLGEALCVEHRYIADLVAGMVEEGLRVDVDFQVD